MTETEADVVLLYQDTLAEPMFCECKIPKRPSAQFSASCRWYAALIYLRCSADVMRSEAYPLPVRFHCDTFDRTIRQVRVSYGKVLHAQLHEG